MARVNTPPTYACGHCGNFGHNKRTCAALAAGQPATPLATPTRVVPSRFDMLVAKIIALTAEANGLRVRQVLVTTLEWDNSASDPNAAMPQPDDAGVSPASDTQVSDAPDTVADDVARILATIEATQDADVGAAVDAAMPVATVGADVADAFGMGGLPNVTVTPVKGKRNRKVA